MASKHSRLPWRVGVTSIEDGGRPAIKSADDFYVTTPAFYPSYGHAVTEDDNAAFIVTACNAHHELVEALKEAQGFISDACPAHGEYILPRIEAALAKVDGGSER